MKTSEPKFWQNKYDLDEIPWNTGTTTPEIINAVNHNKNKKICILGCGYSKDSIYLSQKGHKVYAVDFASSPFEYLLKVKNEKKIENLYPINENIFNLSSNYDSFFDIVIEYTCFCAIPINMRKDYVNLVKSILKRKATFLALFFPTKTKKPESSDPPFYVDIDEVLPIFAKKFKIISLNSEPNSIKPRLGYETFVKMQKK